MTNTPAPTALPGEKPAYVPPRVMRLGDLNEGAGACTAGSGFVEDNCMDGNEPGMGFNCLTGDTASQGACSNGNGAASGTCNTGTGAGVCMPTGSGPA